MVANHREFKQERKFFFNKKPLSILNVALSFDKMVIDTKGRAKHDYMDIGGTSPWRGEGRIMQEQLSRVTQRAVTEDARAENNESINFIP